MSFLASVCTIFLSFVCVTNAQTTIPAGTTLSPGCTAINQVSTAQTTGTCNVTNNVLRIQCQTGACQAYNWSLSSCSTSCASGTSTGPTNSSSYVCSDCSSSSAAQTCSPPVATTPYYCGNTTTTTTSTTTTTTSTSTSTTTSSTTSTTTPTTTTSTTTTSTPTSTPTRTSASTTPTKMTSTSSTIATATTSSTKTSAAISTTATPATSTRNASTIRPTSNTMSTASSNIPSSTTASKPVTAPTTATSAAGPATMSTSATKTSPGSIRTTMPSSMTPMTPTSTTAIKPMTGNSTVSGSSLATSASNTSTTKPTTKSTSLTNGTSATSITSAPSSTPRTGSTMTSTPPTGSGSKVSTSVGSSDGSTKATAAGTASNISTPGSSVASMLMTKMTMASTLPVTGRTLPPSAAGATNSASPGNFSTTTGCGGVTASVMMSTVQPAKDCSICRGCSCPDGFLGDGYDCVLDQCASMTCAPNQYCHGAWSKSNCQFSISFICKCDPAVGCDTGCASAVSSFPMSSYASRSYTIMPSIPSSPLSPAMVPSTSTTRAPTPPSTAMRPSVSASSAAAPPSASSTRLATSSISKMPMTTPSCYNKTIVDAVLTDGCGKSDNQTRIRCADGTCVLFDTAYMNCKKDCPDGIDELCPPGYATCDGCTCALPSEVGTACQDLSTVYVATPCQTSSPPSTSTPTTATRPSLTVQTAKSCIVCHGPNCTCPDGFLGDGIDCVVDQCHSMTCAWNEYCQASWYKSATCQFSTSFICLCDPDIGCGIEQIQTSRTGYVSKKQTATDGASMQTTPPSKGSAVTTPFAVTKEKCYSKTVIDALVTGGCGNKDNVTRIQCSDGTCVPFESAYMNCKKDCRDGIDEQCPPGFVECDGCVCSAPEEVQINCVNLTSAARVLLCPPPVPAKNCTVCHGPSCNCPAGFMGDGIDCAVDQCGTMVQCAWNEICQASWYKSATCEFSTSFTCYCDPDIGCDLSPPPSPAGPISGYVSKRQSASTIAPTSPAVLTSAKAVPAATLASTITTASTSPPSTPMTSGSKLMTAATSPKPTSAEPVSGSKSMAMTIAASPKPTSAAPIASGSKSMAMTMPASTTPTSAAPLASGTVSKKPMTTASTATPTNSMTMTKALPPMTTPPCKTILDAVVMGGCGHNDNVTRIQCADGTCVPFDTAYMDCRKDCADGIDEQCAPGYVKCDGCTCVDPAEVKFACSDLTSIVQNTCGIPLSQPAPPQPSSPRAAAFGPIAAVPAKNCTVCHGASCQCPTGQIGDSIDCAADQCLNMTCKWNEYCQAFWYKTADCQFSTSFMCVCDPSLGCADVPIPPSTASPAPRTRSPVVPPPSDNCTVCHGSNCTCPSGSIGDGITCVPDKCLTMLCTWNEICEGYWYKSEKCEFKTAFRCVCDNNIGCNQTTVTPPPPEPVVCKFDQFLCRTGRRKCIPCAWMEDKVKDCDNGEDEVAGAAVQSKCAEPPVTQYAASGMVTHRPTSTQPSPTTTRSSCGGNYFTCPSDGKCTPCAWINDGVRDCLNGEDESTAAASYCAGVTAAPKATPAPTPDPCRGSQVQCPAHSNCVGRIDGTYYCVCETNYYQDNAQCILHPCFDKSKPSLCDPHAWCDAGNSTTLTSFHQCHCMLPYAGDGKTCQLSSAPEPPACNETQFRCPSDGTCIPTSWVIDHIRDCPNGDDEQPELIDECKMKKALCDSRAICTNIPDGGYNCTCQLPFYGNGFSCWLPITAAAQQMRGDDGASGLESPHQLQSVDSTESNKKQRGGRL